MAAPTILILPGYGDSGPGHWQTLWEAEHGYTRIVQRDWERPERDLWIATLDAALQRTTGPVVFVAHSLGCALVAHWARRGGAARVAGALLVAPPDVDEVRHLLPEIESFAPMPLDPLPFATVLVTSETDPYVEPKRARDFARAWGARLVELGDAGHINVEAGFGPWAAGHRLLAELVAGSAHAVG